MASNKDLGKAKNAKRDEFYTQLTDIEKELRYYSCTISDLDDLDLCEGCGEMKQVFISYDKPSIFKRMRIKRQQKKLNEKEQ